MELVFICQMIMISIHQPNVFETIIALLRSSRCVTSEMAKIFINELMPNKITRKIRLKYARWTSAWPINRFTCLISLSKHITIDMNFHGACIVLGNLHEVSLTIVENWNWETGDFVSIDLHCFYLFKIQKWNIKFEKDGLIFFTTIDLHVNNIFISTSDITASWKTKLNSFKKWQFWLFSVCYGFRGIWNYTKTIPNKSNDQEMI